MNLSTKEIIKILPLDENLKQELLEKYDTLDPRQKYKIDMVMWKGYYTLFKLKLDENLQKALKKVESGEESGESMYGRINQQTEQEMLSLTQKDVASFDLDATREKLQSVISDDTPSVSEDVDKSVN